MLGCNTQWSECCGTRARPFYNAIGSKPKQLRQISCEAESGRLSDTSLLKRIRRLNRWTITAFHNS
jgi:hypothetical protein